MTIAYKVERGLYLNITNKCSNNCTFCIRHNGEGAYGSDSLWLEREPTYEEITEAIIAADPNKYEEIVFCGYGEPSCRLDMMLAVAKWLRENYKIPLRVNTNGQSDLINGRKTASDFAVFDCVSISLNTPNRDSYQRICKCRYGEEGFDAMLRFAGEVKSYTKAVLSVVRQALTSRELEECARICDGIGVPLKIREYISK